MATGGLSLLVPADFETGLQKLTVAERALAETQRRGFQMPYLKQQGYNGAIPHGLVNMGDSQLGDLLNEISSWLEYGVIELAKAKMLRNEAEDKLNFTASKLRLSVKATAEKKLSNPEMDDMVQTDQRWIDAREYFRFADALYEYTKNLVESGRNHWDTVSRQITLRGQEADRHRRIDNVGSIPVVSQSAFRR